MQQEGGAVSWEPGSVPFEFTWQTVVAGVVIGAAVLVYWKALTWFVLRRVQHRGWLATRYALPSLMLATMIPASALSDHYSGPIANILAGLVGCLNLAAAPAIMLLLWLGDRAGLRGPWTGLVACAAVWANWYLVVCLIEWRRHMNAPADSLHLD